MPAASAALCEAETPNARHACKAASARDGWHVICHALITIRQLDMETALSPELLGQLLGMEDTVTQRPLAHVVLRAQPVR